MSKTDAKGKLIQSTIDLLLESGKSEEITSRQIADKAKTNVAMINYYFRSKDELINIAVNQLIKNAADDWKTIENTSQSPDERLLQMLLHLSHLTMKYYSLTKSTTIYELTKADIHLPHYIIPLLEQHFRGKKNEFEIKLAAFEIISFLQILMIKADDFLKYSGKDIHDDHQREYVIKTYLSSILNTV
ncbi:TetR/AcrR family transcriptional regulator [Sporolactobacillus putidus]|uniref:TetR family transcriptional regulator n=1 Tax=Sporolactobacillus putidus TaxID=492735 RepID=A0A917S2J6_9BACL|nr:TetR family transcriptional regulator [Sporolactobacillus putidus]GGL50810.1 TetR family transcriptional regulator [Sporolactobacillus putidus]